MNFGMYDLENDHKAHLLLFQCIALFNSLSQSQGGILNSSSFLMKD